MKKLSILLVLLACITSVNCFAGKKEMKKEKTKHSAPKKKADLQDTHWRLSEMNGHPVAVSNEMGKEAYIVFAAKGRLEGNTGCNSLGGTYNLGRFEAIKIEAVSTKMACDDMDAESKMNNALAYANRYMINGHYLLLYNDNLLLALFEAQYPE